MCFQARQAQAQIWASQTHMDSQSQLSTSLISSVLTYKMGDATTDLAGLMQWVRRDMPAPDMKQARLRVSLERNRMGTVSVRVRMVEFSDGESKAVPGI